jgi:hypothetical protein
MPQAAGDSGNNKATLSSHRKDNRVHREPESNLLGQHRDVLLVVQFEEQRTGEPW